MKELSIEEKAIRYDGNYKAYTELISRLENVKNAIKKQNYGIAMDILCKHYPYFQVTTHSELKESEDEKIRKAIKKTLQVKCDGSRIISDEPVTLEEAIAWIEKQGEQKPVEPQQDMLSQEKYAKAVDECIYGEQKPVNVDYVSGIREELLSIEDSAENIVGLAESQWVAIRAAHRLLGEYIAKEQKLADKVEPKFKVGDCIRHKGADECYIIVTIDDNYYFCENNHAWSIRSQDCFELVEQKSYWGEEDCNRISSIKYLLHELDNYNFDNWLDSLKERYIWKPSDEQMKALHNVFNDTSAGWEDSVIESLYNDLNKLRGE